MKDGVKGRLVTLKAVEVGCNLVEREMEPRKRWINKSHAFGCWEGVDSRGLAEVDANDMAFFLSFFASL